MTVRRQSCVKRGPRSEEQQVRDDAPSPRSCTSDLAPLQPSFHARPLSYQAYTLWLFTRSDINDFVVLGAFFGVLGARAGPALGFARRVPAAALLARVPAMLVWSWANLLLFALHNQRHAASIAEDAINKPWRPLPAKRLTPAEATRLMYAAYPVVLLASMCVGGGLGPCLMLIVAGLWHNEWRGAENPILKNWLSAVGIAGFLAGPLEIALGGPSIAAHPKALGWLLMLAAMISTTIHVQDFRDVAGDKLRARRTIPLVVGDVPVRYMAALAVVAWSRLAASFWELGVLGSLPSGAIGLFLIGKLLLGERTPASDRAAYKIWPLWMVSFFFMPLMK